jgi:hypothetical protein
MTEQEQQLLKEIRAYSVKNYEVDGWDIVEECWEDDDILLRCREESITTLDEFIKEVGPELKTQNDYRKEMQSLVF